MGTVSSMYQAAPSQLSQLAGIGTAAYGVSQMKEGGEVQGYAVGGGITGLLKDEQLQQRTQMPTVSMLAKMAAQDELQARAQMRAGATAQQAPQGDQPSVADEYMASRGIANLPTDEINMAGGGILAFAGGGDEGKKRYMPLWERAEKQRLEKGSIYSPDFGTPIDDRQAALDARKAEEAAARETPAWESDFYPQGQGEAWDAIGDALMYSSDKAAMEKRATEKASAVESNASDALRGKSRKDSRAARKAKEDKRPPVAQPQQSKTAPAAAAEAKPRPVSAATAGTAPAESGLSLAQVQAMHRGDPSTRQAYIDQMDLANAAREDTFKQGIANIKRDQEALGEYGTEREAKLKKQEEGLAGLEKRNKSMAFIEAGLAIMSGNSANAFENIGKGALVGTKAYREGMDKIDAKRTKLDEAFMNLYDIRRGEKVANKKELRAAENALETAKADSAKTMADVTGKLFDADRADSRAAIDTYTKIKEGELDRASREQVANIGANATMSAAKYRASTLTEYQRSQLRNQAASEVDKALAKNVRLQMQAAKDPSIRDRMIEKAYNERLNAAGASGGQADAGGVTMNFDAQGNPI